MFSTTQKVSSSTIEATENRLRRASSETDPPLLVPFEMQLSEVLKKHNNTNSRIQSQSILPLHLASTEDDVQNLYPKAPSVIAKSKKEDVFSEKGTSNDTSSQLHTQTEYRSSFRNLPPLKRERGKDNNDEDEDKKNAHTDAGVQNGPSMSFVDGFQFKDYMGRSFLLPPSSLEQKLMERGSSPMDDYHPPRVLSGLWRGHNAGIQKIRLAPYDYGHLLFSVDLNGEARLWEASGSRKLIATYSAHSQPAKSLELTRDATLLSTGSVDGTIALWDVESGSTKGIITNDEKLPVVQHIHHPTHESALLLAALDKKIVLYDTRTSLTKFQREYTGHMGTIFHLSLLTGGTKMLSTSEDKTLRTWDFRVPVQIKQFADTGMHAITHVISHPSEPFLAAQSLNNQVLVFKDEGAGKLKLLRQRSFSGHVISGTRCQLAFSADGRFISSGDISGKMYVWKWENGELVKSYTAHQQMLISHQWHPLETSRIITSSWDKFIKNWK